MRRIVIVAMSLFTSTGALSLLSCDKDKSSSTSPAPAAAPGDDPSTTDPSAAVVGAGATITGTLAVGNSVPQTAVQSATLTIEGHPEVTGTSDEQGNFTLEAVPPGTVVVYALSAEGSALQLTAGASAYGFKSAEMIVKDKEKSELGNATMNPTGTLAGKIALLTNSNNLSMLGADVFVPGTSFIAKTAEDGSFTLSGMPEGTYKISVLLTGFAVTSLVDVSIVGGQTTTLADIVLSLANGPEGSISVAGNIAPVTIGGKIREVMKNASNVSIQLKYDNDAALMKISDEPSFLNKEWKAVAPTADWTFTSDGFKTLYVMYSDLNGLESSPYSAEIVVDTAPPVIDAVRVMNGWAQSVAANVYADVDATDSGSGIAEVAYSGTVPSLTSIPYVPFVSHITSVPLVPGTGSRSVYVRVKDFAGNESVIVSDSIAISTETVIADMSYVDSLTLSAAFNPYLVADDVVIAKDLTIEPGVTLKIDRANKLEVKGKFTAVGTAGLPITIAIEELDNSTPCLATSMPTLKLDAGLPGVSEDNRVKHVNFEYMNLAVNGGQFETNTFSSTTCSDRGATLTKSGRDALILKGNTFDNWGWIKVAEGDALTTLDGNTGSFETFYWQAGSARNSIIKDNVVERHGNQSDAFVIVEANNLTFGAGNDLDGGNGSLFQIKSVVDVTISRANVTSCGTLLVLAQNIQATIEDSTISGCSEVVTRVNSFSSSAIVRYSELSFTRTINGGGAYGYTPVTISRSKVVCDAVASGYCDFLNVYVQGGGTASLTLNENNITCEADAGAPNYGCRGFVVYAPNANGGNIMSGTMALTITDNHWTGKAFDTSFAATPIYTDEGAEPSTNDATTVEAFEFGDGGGDNVNFTWPASFPMQRAMAWGAGDVGPRP